MKHIALIILFAILILGCTGGESTEQPPTQTTITGDSSTSKTEKSNTTEPPEEHCIPKPEVDGSPDSGRCLVIVSNGVYDLTETAKNLWGITGHVYGGHGCGGGSYRCAKARTTS